MDLGDIGGRSYTWDAATAVTVAVDLWEVVMTSGLIARVGGISLSQTTELGDAAHEIINFQYVWGNTSTGSGGGTPVGNPIGFPATYTGVSGAECRNTTAASGGSPEPTIAHGWNVLQPVDIWYPNGLEPQLRPTDGGGELNAIRLLAAPADSLTMISTLYIRNGVHFS